MTWIVALLVGLAPAQADPSGITLDVKVEPAEVHLADRAELVVTARHPQTVRLFFPASPDIEPFRLLGDPVGPEVVTEGDQVIETWRVPVAAMRLGRRKVPPFPIDYENAEKETGEVMTPAVSVNVAPRLDLSADTVEMRGNAPPMQVLDTNWALILFLIGLGVVAVTAVITLLAVRYVAGLPKRGPPPAPPRPAHEIAYERLEALAAENLLAGGQLKEHTFRVSEILREYLGNRYDFEALERTTSELVGELKRKGPAGLSIYELEAFLQDTDLVKFAGITPAYREAEKALESCRRIIEATRRSDAEVSAMRQAEEHRRRLEKPAHPFKRTFAVLIDLLLFGVISAGLCITALKLDAAWPYWLDGILLVAFFLLRDIYGDGSPGKVLTGLAVTPLEDTRSIASAGARILRNLPLLLPVAGHTMELVVMTYAADGRRVGDRWAFTRVLDRRPDASEYTFGVLSLVLAAAVVVVAWLVPFVWVGA